MTDMAKYTDSLPIVDQCIGCNKVFDFIYQGTEDAAPEKRCLAYYNPAAKWPYEGQKFAMHTVMVRKRNAQGHPESLSPEEVPIVQKYCGLASHYQVSEIVKTSAKVHVGQQKQKKVV